MKCPSYGCPAIALPAITEGQATAIVAILHHIGVGVAPILENAMGIVVVVLQQRRRMAVAARSCAGGGMLLLQSVPVSHQSQDTRRPTRSAAVLRCADNHGRALDRQSLKVVEAFDPVAPRRQPGIVDGEIRRIAGVQ